MQKYHWWLLFFFSIFGFTFAMIIWTIMSASKVDIHEEQSFMSSYQNVDDNFNNMMISNANFAQKYNVKLLFNENEIEVSVQDIFLAQRALEAKSTNKNLLKVGLNTIAVFITDKNGNNIQNVKVKMLLTRSTTNHNDIIIETFAQNGSTYQSQADITVEGNWNITGTISVNDDNAYFYIKTKSIL